MKKKFLAAILAAIIGMTSTVPSCYANNSADNTTLINSTSTSDSLEQQISLEEARRRVDECIVDGRVLEAALWAARAGFLTLGFGAGRIFDKLFGGKRKDNTRGKYLEEESFSESGPGAGGMGHFKFDDDDEGDDGAFGCFKRLFRFGRGSGSQLGAFGHIENPVFTVRPGPEITPVPPLAPVDQELLRLAAVRWVQPGNRDTMDSRRLDMFVAHLGGRVDNLSVGYRTDDVLQWIAANRPGLRTLLRVPLDVTLEDFLSSVPLVGLPSVVDTVLAGYENYLTCVKSKAVQQESGRHGEAERHLDEQALMRAEQDAKDERLLKEQDELGAAAGRWVTTNNVQWLPATLTGTFGAALRARVGGDGTDGLPMQFAIWLSANRLPIRVWLRVPTNVTLNDFLNNVTVDDLNTVVDRVMRARAAYLASERHGKVAKESDGRREEDREAEEQRMMQAEAKAAEEAAKKAAEEEAAKKAAEEEAARKAAEEEAAKKATEEEATKKAAEEEAKKAARLNEAQRIVAERVPTPSKPVNRDSTTEEENVVTAGSDFVEEEERAEKIEKEEEKEVVDESRDSQPEEKKSDSDAEKQQQDDSTTNAHEETPAKVVNQDGPDEEEEQLPAYTTKTVREETPAKPVNQNSTDEEEDVCRQNTPRPRGNQRPLCDSISDDDASCFGTPIAGLGFYDRGVGRGRVLPIDSPTSARSEKQTLSGETDELVESVEDNSVNSVGETSFGEASNALSQDFGATEVDASVEAAEEEAARKAAEEEAARKAAEEEAARKAAEEEAAKKAAEEDAARKAAEEEAARKAAEEEAARKAAEEAAARKAAEEEAARKAAEEEAAKQ